MSYDPDVSDNENLCQALYAIASALRDLGFGADRHRGPGAIEGHSMMMRDHVAPKIAEAIVEGLRDVASALENHK